MTNDFCFDEKMVRDLTLFLSEKTAQSSADSIKISFRGLFRCSTKDQQTASAPRFITEYLGSEGKRFYLDLNLAVFRYLFDGTLGFRQPFESSEEGPEDLSELEILSAKPFQKIFAPIGSILFRNSKDTSFEINCSKGSLQDFENTGSSRLIQLEFDLSLGTFLSTIGIILSVSEEIWAKVSQRDVYDGPEIPALSRNGSDSRIVIKIGTTRIPTADLRDLHRNDIIWTTIPANVLYTVEIDGKPAFYGRPGRFQNQMAFQIIGRGAAPLIETN